MTIPPVVVLAGGAGTRARPYLADCPKILAPVFGGRLMIDAILDELERQGVDTVVFCLGHGARQPMGYLAAHPRRLRLRFAVDPEPGAGTVPALRHAVAELRLAAPLIVINGDTLWDCDLAALVAHRGAAVWAYALAPDPAGHPHAGIDAGIRVLGKRALRRVVESPCALIESALAVVPGAPYPIRRAVDIGTWDGYCRASRGNW